MSVPPCIFCAVRADPFPCLLRCANFSALFSARLGNTPSHTRLSCRADPHRCWCRAPHGILRPAHSAPDYVRTAPGGTCRPREPLLRPGAQRAASLPCPVGSGRSQFVRRDRRLLLGTTSRDFSSARSRGARGGLRVARRNCAVLPPEGALDLSPDSDAKLASLASGGDVIAPSGRSPRTAFTPGIPLNCPWAKQVLEPTGPCGWARPLGPHGARPKVPGWLGVGTCAPGSGKPLLDSMRLR